MGTAGEGRVAGQDVPAALTSASCWLGPAGLERRAATVTGDGSPGRGGAGAKEAGRATWAGGGPGTPRRAGPAAS